MALAVSVRVGTKTRVSLGGRSGRTLPMAGKPLWRQAFDAVDRRVSGPLEAGARSDAFTDVVTVGWRLRRRVQREVERRTRHVLHVANLPTATDVRRLSEQVSSLQREVREIQDRRP